MDSVQFTINYTHLLCQYCIAYWKTRMLLSLVFFFKIGEIRQKIQVFLTVLTRRLPRKFFYGPHL